MRHLFFLFFFLLFAIANTVAQSHTLDYYVNQGLKNSPLLKDYQLQIASNSVDSLKVKATFKPQVGLNGQLYYAPSYNGYGYDGAATNGGNYQAQVLASQSLIIKRSKRVQMEGLNIQNQYLDHSSKITQLDLTKAVTDQYILAYRDYHQIQVVNEIMTLLDNEAELLKPQVERGIYAQTDYLNVKLLKEGQVVTLRQYQLQYRTDLY